MYTIAIEKCSYPMCESKRMRERERRGCCRWRCASMKKNRLLRLNQVHFDGFSYNFDFRFGSVAIALCWMIWGPWQTDWLLYYNSRCCPHTIIGYKNDCQPNSSSSSSSSKRHHRRREKPVPVYDQQLHWDSWTYELIIIIIPFNSANLGSVLCLQLIHDSDEEYVFVQYIMTKFGSLWDKR